MSIFFISTDENSVHTGYSSGSDSDNETNPTPIVTNESDGALKQGLDKGGPKRKKSDESDLEEDDDSEDEEVEGEMNGTLASMAVLDDALTANKGLSMHFSGKTKSFTSLRAIKNVQSMKEIEKVESPLNKRRRIMRASYLQSKLYGSRNCRSAPVLPRDDDEEETGRSA